MLDVDPERGDDEHRGDIDPADHAVQPRKPRAHACAELRDAEQEGRGPDESVRQQPPADGAVVGPGWVGRVDEEALVVVRDVRDHQRYASEQQVLGTHVPRPALRQGKSGQRKTPADRFSGSDYTSPGGRPGAAATAALATPLQRPP